MFEQPKVKEDRSFKALWESERDIYWWLLFSIIGIASTAFLVMLVVSIANSSPEINSLKILMLLFLACILVPGFLWIKPTLDEIEKQNRKG
jgi:hypothetical protein